MPHSSLPHLFSLPPFSCLFYSPLPFLHSSSSHISSLLFHLLIFLSSPLLTSALRISSIASPSPPSCLAFSLTYLPHLHLHLSSFLTSHSSLHLFPSNLTFLSLHLSPFLPSFFSPDHISLFVLVARGPMVLKKCVTMRQN